MKKLLSIVSLALLAGTLYAGQQNASFNGTTNTVAANSTSNYVAFSTTFDCTKSTDLTLAASVVGLGTNTSTITFGFSGSIDASHWQTNYLTFTLTAADTAKATVVTNVPSGLRVPYLRLDYITNPNGATGITNLWVGAFTKSGL